MRKVCLAVVLLCLLGGCVAAENPAEPAESAVARLLRYRAQEKTLARARRLLQRRQAVRAEAALRDCLAALPGHYEAHAMLAQLAAERADFAAAVAHMEQAEAELQRLQALCRDWQEKRRQDETIDRELLSGEAQQSMIRSSCRLAGSKVDTAQLDAEVGVAPAAAPMPLDPARFEVPAAYSFAHGNFLFKSRRWAEAAGHYRLAVERDPRLAAAWNNLLSSLRLAGQAAEARAWLERAGQAGVAIVPGLRREIETDAPR